MERTRAVRCAVRTVRVPPPMALSLPPWRALVHWELQSIGFMSGLCGSSRPRRKHDFPVHGKKLQKVRTHFQQLHFQY